MISTSRQEYIGLCLLLLSAMAATTRPAQAYDPTAAGELSAFTVYSEELHTPPIPIPFQQLPRFERTDAIIAFTQELGIAGDDISQSGIFIDRRTGRPSLLRLPGLPWVPGAGNQLTIADIQQFLEPGERRPTARSLELIAEDFIGSHSELLGVSLAHLGPAAVTPDHEGSLAFGLTRSAWIVNFPWQPHDRTVRGGWLTFVVNNGNLVHISSAYIDEPSEVASTPVLDGSQATDALAAYLGSAFETVTTVDPPELVALPTDPGGSWKIGEGLTYRLAWEILIEDSQSETWRASVDASTGVVLQLVSTMDRMAEIRGNVARPKRVVNPLLSVPMPWADYSPTQVSDAQGQFTCSPGARSTLDGRYVRVVDRCAELPHSPFVEANPECTIIDLGGDDNDWGCQTGPGGEGNTLAARTSYYYLSRAIEVLRNKSGHSSWPKLFVTTNISRTNQTVGCNAGFSEFQSKMSFWPSNGICTPLGEVEGVILHEFGHYADHNSGNGMSEKSTEGIADIHSVLWTRDSCVSTGALWGEDGDPSYPNPLCGDSMGYACPLCTGLREVDYRRRNPASRRTVTDILQGLCVESENPGPCGVDQYCENATMTGAFWELATRELPARYGYSQNQAWQVASDLWYGSDGGPGALFGIGDEGFTCAATNGGAGHGTLYAALRAADDCDGNPTNGTPHAEAIFAALSAHGIAEGHAAAVHNRDNDCSGPLPTGKVAVTFEATGEGIENGGTLSLPFIPGAFWFQLPFEVTNTSSETLIVDSIVVETSSCLWTLDHLSEPLPWEVETAQEMSFTLRATNPGGSTECDVSLESSDTESPFQFTIEY